MMTGKRFDCANCRQDSGPVKLYYINDGGGDWIAGKRCSFSGKSSMVPVVSLFVAVTLVLSSYTTVLWRKA